jgi:lactoylglutathione lyase
MMQDWAERKPSIVFECENIQKTFEEMRDHGVQFTQEPKTMPWGTVHDFLDTKPTRTD